MKNPEKANMRLTQEWDTAQTHIHQRINSFHLMAEVFNCDTDDIEIVLALLRTHGVFEIIEEVNDFAADAPFVWSFGMIVIAAKNTTLKRIQDKIYDELHRKLSTVVVSTKPSIYGAVVAGGEGLDEKTMMAFSDMIKYGVNIERTNALNKAYKAAGV